MKENSPATDAVHAPFVGSYSPRIDALEKASGRADYLADLAVGMRAQGLLYASCLRSPYPAARIVSLDTSRAEAVPGVVAVLTCNDDEVRQLKPTNASWTPFFTASYERMSWPSYRDRRVLGDTAHWAGDEVGVVVAAETKEAADAALAALDVEWEEKPFVLDLWEAIEPGAPLVHPEINPEGNTFPPPPPLTGPTFLERGDVEQGFAESDVQVEFETSYHNPDHGCLETRGCILQWDGDHLTCWTSYYAADQPRMSLANMLDMPLNKVRVMNPYIGGSFGRGNEADQPFLVFTALLAKRCGGRPVLYRMDRRQDFHDTRSPVLYRVRAGARADGTILALHTKAYSRAGAYADDTMGAADEVPREVAELSLAPIPNLRMEAYCVYTNTIPGGVKRGIGNNELNLAWGRLLDEVAERLGLDPVDVALKNMGSEWSSMPDRSLAAVLREGAGRIGWERRLPAPADVTAPADPSAGPVKRRGLGMSVHNTWHAAWQEIPRGRVQVRLTLNPDGSVVLDAPTAETGTGSSSCSVFACADALAFLGVGAADVTYLAHTDTDRGLKDMVQTDSAVSYLQAELMPKAAEELKRKLVAHLARLLEVPEDEVDVRAGRVFWGGGPDDGRPLADILLQQSDLGSIVVDVEDLPPAQVTGCPFLACFAEVEVDTETGAVEVVQAVQATDCGKVMYRAGADGQLVGGVTMAASEALLEQIVYDERTGLPLNFNWVDYRMATLADGPPVEPVALEVWRGAGNHPASGLGESAITAGPAAIANAVHNALGVHLSELPITPEKVLEALGRKLGAQSGQSTPDARPAHRSEAAGQNGGVTRIEYRAATGVAEAEELLRAGSGRARLLAGGTDIYGALKAGVHSDDEVLLVDLKTIPGLGGISETDGEVVIGALTRLADLARDDLVNARLPLLAEAARAIASPQLREMGTVGGNLCQETRCWYYRYPDDTFHCHRKGGELCAAAIGDNRYHSIFGSARVVDPPCVVACPNHNGIPIYLEALRRLDLEEAARLLLRENPLPAITGRVCPHACEQGCNRCGLDEALSIRNLEREVGDYALAHPEVFLGSEPPASGKHVAVVGSGPGGLTAAYFLRRRGHAVTVFEREERAGGMLALGIPPFRLSPEVVGDVIGLFEQLGVEFRCGVDVGGAVSLDELQAGHDAVIVACGAWEAPRIGVEGEEATVSGLDYLRHAALAPDWREAGEVLVVGGGNVAVDAAMTALARGATSVTMACLESRAEMPAFDEEIAEALEAGVQLREQWGPRAIRIESGAVTGVDLVRCTCVFDEHGAFCPTLDESVRDFVAADKVVMAVGQQVDRSWLGGLGTSTVVCGDAATGPATIVEAIASGRSAADSVARLLAPEDGAEPPAPEVRPYQPAALLIVDDESPGRTSRRDDVLEEARRCLDCSCIAVSPSDLAPALIALGARVETTARTLDAELLFAAAQDGSTILEPDEILLRVRVPLPTDSARGAFKKFRERNSIDFPIVNLAVQLEMSETRIVAARLCAGAVAPMPLRLVEAERCLAQQEPSLSLCRQAAAAAVRSASPLRRNRYKRQILQALVRRALEEAMGLKA